MSGGAAGRRALRTDPDDVPTMFGDGGVDADGEAAVDFRWSGFPEVPCG